MNLFDLYEESGLRLFSTHIVCIALGIAIGWIACVFDHPKKRIK